MSEYCSEKLLGDTFKYVGEKLASTDLLRTDWRIIHCLFYLSRRPIIYGSLLISRISSINVNKNRS